MLNFFRDIKIGYLDSEAQRLLSESTTVLEAESLSVTMNHLENGNTKEASDFLEGTTPSLDLLVDLKDKYVKLREKYKYDITEQLRIVTDWKDFNEMLNKLLTHRESADALYFQTRSKEIINRFEKLLQS